MLLELHVKNLALIEKADVDEMVGKLKTAIEAVVK